VDLHYFAYGSNLHPARLKVRAPSAKFVEVGVMPDRALRFCKRSVDGSAKCTLIPALGSRAFGAVYRLDAADKAALDLEEGLGQGYREEWLGIPLREQVVRVFYYLATDNFVDFSLPPYHWYKRLVLAGARHLGLPPGYIATIELVQSIDDPDPERRARNETLLEACNGSGEEPAVR
jgi:AIG2-like family